MRSPSLQLPFGDAEDGAVDCHGAVIDHIVCAQPAFEDDLQLRGRRRHGDEDRYEPKKVIFRTAFFMFPNACQHRHFQMNHMLSSSKNITVCVVLTL